jgi:hypothetical protein
MTGAQSSNAVRDLIRFIPGLAIRGMLVAQAWYFAVDLPTRQVLLHVPLNAIPPPVNGQST